ncbi:MAG TPA: CHAP domain-containing protein [Bacilli bacterium]|nr:CHAP domain-containing protein [Bacilli bacterium]
MSSFFSRNKPGSSDSQPDLPNNSSIQKADGSTLSDDKSPSTNQSPIIDNNSYENNQGQRPFRLNDNQEREDLGISKRPLNKNTNPNSFQDYSRRDDDFEDSINDLDEDEEDIDDEYDNEEENDIQNRDSRNKRDSKNKSKDEAKEKLKNKAKKNSETDSPDKTMGRAAKNKPISSTAPNISTDVAGANASVASTSAGAAGVNTAGTAGATSAAGAAGASTGAAGAGAAVATSAGASAATAGASTGAAAGGTSILPYILIGVAGLVVLGILIFYIYILVVTLSPGSGGDDLNNYSKKDREILQKIAMYTMLHPDVDSALALSVIYYPHNEAVFSGNVLYYIGAEDTSGEETDGEIDNEKSIEERLEELEKDKDGDTDDVNLLIIEEYLDEFGKVLQTMETEGENFEKYLKTDYFLNNKYYKKLLKRRNKKVATEAQLIDAIYEDVSDLTQYMQNYIHDYSNGNCTVSVTDGGKINFDSSKIASTYIQLVDDTCTGSFSTCTATNYIGEPIDLKTYVMGVTYAEIGVSSESYDEEIKAQIIAAKSYTLSRSEVMGRTITTEAGKTIRYMNNNTNDQVYCNVSTGCEANGGSNPKPALPQDQQDRLSSLYDSVSNKYIYDKETTKTYGAYVNSINDESTSCKAGSCMFQEQVKQFAKENKDYQTILFQSYSEEGRFALLDISDNSVSIGTVDCTIASAVAGIRTKRPTAEDKYFNPPINNASGSEKFQCPWYARSRAMEIVNTSTLDAATKQRATNALLKVTGNASQWWGNSYLDATFARSNNVNAVKAGSIVVWQWPPDDIPRWAGGNNYGHVGIVEAVTDEGVVISEGWRIRTCPRSSESYLCMGFNNSTWSVEKVNRSSRYQFLGYYYLLEVKNN